MSAAKKFSSLEKQVESLRKVIDELLKENYELKTMITSSYAGNSKGK